MKSSVKLNQVRGRICAPASKSVAQRVLALALLARGTGVFRGLGQSDDVLAAKGLVGNLGVHFEELDGDSLLVQSPGQISGHRRVDCGESGLCLRMFAPLAALAGGPVTLAARGGLLQRPVDMLGGLAAFGVGIELSGGRPPVRVCGPLRAASAEVDGERTSQVITGLIMALSQCAGESRLNFKGGELASRPYVELTLDCMNRFGLQAELGPDHCRIPGGQRAVMPENLVVEGDWSGAAFWLVAGALSGPVCLDGLVRGSGQADEAVCRVLVEAGARLDWSAGEVTVCYGTLKPFHFDARDCPDIVPPLVVLAAACPGRSVIRGVRRLAIKECDRGRSLVEILQALGGRAGIDAQADTLWVEGGRPLRGGAVSSCGDHRMAMAGALLSLLTQGEVEIDDLACTAKSYPAFWDHLNILGGIR